MTVKDLKEELAQYDDNAEIIAIDWSNGRTFDITVGSDDEDEGTAFCRIGIN